MLSIISLLAVAAIWFSKTTSLPKIYNLIFLDNLIVCAINLICYGVLDAVGMVCVVFVWWAGVDE